MSTELLPQYDPKRIEDAIYRVWEESGFFNPDRLPPVGADQHGQKRGSTRTLPRESASSPRKSAFTIIMPPPNANGSLHIGHAVFVTLQDIMIRYKRMQGFKTLWLPGADHAGFETQVVFDKKLEKEGRTRFTIPRDQLYQEMLAFTLENKKVMEGQLRRLGASCDWSREKFTLDSDIVQKIQDAFVDFYKKGLVYRGERVVHWCVRHQTALADLETSYIEKKDPLYYFQYGPFVIATARPETKFGDKYVVMHPKDKRYATYKNGQKINLEWINGPITAIVIKDDAIDMAFGTGVMTITPWHDPIDFEIAERHGLQKEQIIDRLGRLLPIAGEFAGMKIVDARPRIAEKLKAKGLLVKIEEEYDHKIAVCYKCKNPIEPQILPQWFLRMKPLAEKAIEAVERGKITFVPPRFKKIYFHWLRSIRDWNLSQQITWGIRIPAWFCHIQTPPQKKIGFHESVVPQVFDGKISTWRLRDHGLKIGDAIAFENTQAKELFGFSTITNIFQTTVGEINLKDTKHYKTYKNRAELIAAFKRHNPQKELGVTTPVFVYEYAFRRISADDEGCGKVIVSSERQDVCPNCHSSHLMQDPDVFTTWFSSGQWPFLALGYPDSRDYKTFYPTTVMETGWDILFFWVARMVMLGITRTGKIPFKTIYLNGLLRDKDRQKMSKSKGNMVNPLDLTEQYGTDALRMALVIGNLPGNDIIISEDNIRGYRNFANKIWNATRFVLMHIDTVPNTRRVTYGKKEKALLLKLKKLTRDTTRDLDAFRFHHAAERLYHFFWHYYADKVIEEIKPRLALPDGSTEKEAAQALLLEFHTTLITLLHPFMPFITEEIWKHLPIQNKNLLMIEHWPQ